MNPQPPSDLQRWLEVQRELMLLMAHDLRNPLAAVLANLNFVELAARPEDTDLLEAVADVKLSAEMLLRMVENLVAIARLEAAPAGADGERAEIVEAVRAGFDRGMPFARAVGVHIDLQIRGEGIVAGIDRALLELLVENLVGNVTQHVRRGHRAVLTLETVDGQAVLTLDDDGPAFGPPERDFSREGQLEIKKYTEGRYSRGLALYVVGLVTRALRGTLVVRDDDGRGHLQVRLPLVTTSESETP